MRAAAAFVSVAAVASCATGPSSDDPAGRQDLLENNLSVAAAAFTAGQPSVARRLYRSLAERFDEAPEPLLGLAYIASLDNDLPAAKDYFLGAAALAEEAPAIKAEALLGAGRTALAQGTLDDARRHFGSARESAGRGPSAAWVANGIGVLASLEGDYEAAEAEYRRALRLSSGHPGITANFVRMLLAAGKEESAAEVHARHDPSFWLGEDGSSLWHLIEEARRERRRQAAARAVHPSLAMRLRAQEGDGPAARETALPGSTGALLRIAERPSPRGPGTEREAPPVQEAEAAADRTPGVPLPATMTLSLGQSRRLGLDSSATSLLVAAPEVADVQLLSPDVLYIVGKSVGRTSVAVLGEDGRVRDWIVSVVLDLEPVRANLAGEPDLRGVRARRVARGIALSGDVASATLAERALRLAAAALPKDTIVENELRVAGAQQVSLEVQIAEVQRSLSEDLGINWEAFRTPGDNVFGFRIGRLASIPSVAGSAIGAFAPSLVDGQPSPGLFFGRHTKNTRISGMIDALARAGSANVLARPNLTAVSGEAASFFSGGEYPLPTGFEDGVILFEYKKYGVLLDFVPTVIDAGRIVLKVRPEVSEPSLNQAVQVVGVNIPVINVRRAETTVEVGDGDSIVIGGLFRNASDTREAGLPVLKDIPLLGPLFGHRSIRSEDLELVVIVTARLVRSGGSPEERNEPAPALLGGYYY